MTVRVGGLVRFMMRRVILSRDEFEAMKELKIGIGHR